MATASVFAYIPQAEVCYGKKDKDLDLPSPPLSLLPGSPQTYAEVISLLCITPSPVKGTLLHSGGMMDLGE